MLRDGLYELFYRVDADPSLGSDSLLLALRDGNILGSDKWGGLLTGRCDFITSADEHRVCVQLHVPPGGMLVTDAAPHSTSRSVALDLRFGEYADLASGLVEVAGQPVRVELLFKGPMPGNQPSACRSLRKLDAHDQSRRPAKPRAVRGN